MKSKKLIFDIYHKFGQKNTRTQTRTQTRKSTTNILSRKHYISLTKQYLGINQVMMSLIQREKMPLYCQSSTKIVHINEISVG